MKIKGCKVKRVVIERALVVGPMAIESEAREHLHREGFRITEQGPYTDRKMWPGVDPTRFRCVAEREIDA